MRSLDFHNTEIGGISSRKDKSVRFSVETAELTPDQAAALLAYHGAVARVVIYPQTLQADEHVEVQALRDRKTPSQRLRGALWKLHQHLQVKEPFESWYGNEIEKLIQTIKKELP